MLRAVTVGELRLTSAVGFVGRGPANRSNIPPTECPKSYKVPLSGRCICSLRMVVMIMHDYLHISFGL